MAPEAQESRTEKTAITLTPTEKTALVRVSKERDMPEAHLLREMLIVDIVEEYERIEFERLEAKFRAERLERTDAADADDAPATEGVA